jgi:hypothetical protein
MHKINFLSPGERVIIEIQVQCVDGVIIVAHFLICKSNETNQRLNPKYLERDLGGLKVVKVLKVLQMVVLCFKHVN